MKAYGNLGDYQWLWKFNTIVHGNQKPNMIIDDYPKPDHQWLQKPKLAILEQPWKTSHDNLKWLCKTQDSEHYPLEWMSKPQHDHEWL